MRRQPDWSCFCSHSPFVDLAISRYDSGTGLFDDTSGLFT
jgi:hypothetical protein